MDHTILLIDDDLDFLEALQKRLITSGFKYTTIQDDPLKAAALFETGEIFDIALIDMTMPNMDGIELLERIKSLNPRTECIMLTAVNDARVAVECLKKGAYDYLVKPIAKEDLAFSLKRTLERKRLLDILDIEQSKTLPRLKNTEPFKPIVTKSHSVLRILKEAELHAGSDVPILITGESGTGKELFARAIHADGPRASGPMVSINCGGIPENLLESELFGYKKGAFTDAVKDKQGHFEEADKGTIFLDEIGEMPPSLQVKLLRVLQEEEITALGDVGSKKIDVRIIAATSKVLEEELREGRFREDLFYRLNVMTIHLPPLRERRGDITLLVGYFIDIFNKKLKKNIQGLSSEAMPVLIEYTWPGNVRELENVIERAILLAPGRWISPAELPENMMKAQKLPPYLGSDEDLSIKKASKWMERDLIEKALKLTNGNRTQAAKILEVSRPMLIGKIKEYELDL